MDSQCLKHFLVVLVFEASQTRERVGEKLHIFLFVPVVVYFQAGWRVISAQTDGEKNCGAPGGKDARSDQTESCCWREVGVWGTATFCFCSSVSGR